VVGQKILVDNYPMTIVGVSAAGFTGLDPARSPQVRIPVQMKPLMTPGWDAIGDRRSQWIQMFARMKPGYTVESARASLQPLFTQILREELVVAQVAFSFLLLAGSGLFVRTLANLKQTNPGFQNLENLVTFQIEPALNGYTLPRLKIFNKQLLEAVRATPGVKSAGFAMVPVLSGGEWDSTMSVEGHTAKDGEDTQAFMNGISSDYWKTMGVPLVEGRDFNDHDAGTKVTAAIVNRKFATHFFGGKSPIGRRIGFGGGPKSKLDIEIVGVTADSLYEAARGRAPAGLRAARTVGLSDRRCLLRENVDGFPEHVRGTAP
jgi:hypothetical protein